MFDSMNFPLFFTICPISRNPLYIRAILLKDSVDTIGSMAFFRKFIRSFRIFQLNDLNIFN